MGGERARGRGRDRGRRRDRSRRDLDGALTYRLLALDIDGTLLGADKRISPRVRQAVEAARARGVRVALVTGRRHPSARVVAEDLGGAPPLVLHNGALVLLAGEVSRCRPLAREAALRAARIGIEAGTDPVVHWGQRGEGLLLVTGDRPSSTLLAYYLDRSHPDVRVVSDLEGFLEEDPIQVMFGGSIESMSALLPRLQDGLRGAATIERTVYPRLGLALIDVLAPGVDKAEAVAYLQGAWGISPAETMAIGDNWNDHAMLRAAGLGLVMGNADEGTLALGLPVLPTNEEDGVAWAIERHVLGA